MSTVGQGAGYLVGGIAGFFIGGPSGAIYGAQIGGMIGGYLDPPKQKGNKPQTDLSVQTATYGAPIGTGYGNYAKYGNLFWVEGNKLRLETGSSGGGKGGHGGQKKARPDEIYGTFAIGFGEGEIVAFGRIWCNGKLVYDPTAGTLGAKMANGDVSGNLTFYTGSATQLPDPRMQADMGVAHTPAYRGLHWIMFSDWPMADYGNTLMGVQVKAEIINSATVTQYVRHVFSQDQIPDTSTYPGAWGIQYGYFNPRIQDGIFRCDIASVANSYAYTYSIGFEGNLLSRESGAYETGVFGYIGQCAAGSVTYVGSTTGTFKVGGADWKLKTADANNTCHGMAVGGDGRIYALERVAGSWLFNIYDGDSLALISSGNNSFIRLGSNHISNPCIPGTDVSFCIEQDGIHVWSAQSGGGNWNFLVGEISAGSLVQLHSYTDGYLGAIGRYACICAAFGVCYGVNNHGDFFVYDRIKTLNKTNATLASIIEKRCLLSGLLSAGDLDTSAISQTVRGYKVDGVASIRNSLEPLQGAWPFDIVPSGYQIKFKPRGASPVATIDITELGAVSGNEKVGDILTQSREMDTQLPVKVQVTYIDANREYDKGTGPGAWRTNTDAVNVQAIDMPIVLNADEVAGIEETLLYMYWMERADFNFNLPPTWNALEAADVFTVNEPGASYEFRLVEPIYLPDGRLECSAKLNSATLYTWTAKGQEGQSTGQVLSYPGASLLTLLDIPCVDSRYMDKPGILAAVGGYSAAWKGGALFRSDDSGQTWNDVQDFTAPGATMGAATNSIGDASAYTVDRASRLNVRLFKGSLASVSEVDMFNGANHFAYGQPGRWEIIAAKNATQESDDTWTLSGGLMRGRFGTEQYMGDHAINDVVVLLDPDQIRFVGLGVTDIGITKKWRPVTAGRSVESAIEKEYAYSAVNLECISPAGLNGSRHPVTLDWSLVWDRRSRTPVRFLAGSVMPLGETSELYDVEIWDATYSTLKRTISGLTSALATYSSAEQIADFGANQETLYLKIYQRSSVVGRGYPLQASIYRPVPLDPFIADVRILLHMEGANGSTTFTDVFGHSITAIGNAQHTTTDPLYGTSSYLGDGSGDWLEISDSADIELGASDFAIEATFKLSGYSISYSGYYVATLVGKAASGAGNLAFYFALSGTASSWDNLYFVANDGSYSVSVPFSFALNTRYRVAVCRSGSNLRFFVEGTQVGSTQAISITIANNAIPWSVGGITYTANNYSLPGRIDEVRVTWAPRLVSNYTPSAVAFPDS